MTSGRGNAKVTIDVSFDRLERWARRQGVDTPRLMRRSFGRACSSLKRQFADVVANAGGKNGVPKFAPHDPFTIALRRGEHRPVGGVLSERSRVVAFKRGGWQFIGWPDALAKWAENFQDAVGNEAQLNDPYFRRRAHRMGIRDVPRTYVHNLRRVIPEPFGSHVQANLEEWAKGAFYKDLAKQMKKAGDL